MTNNFRSPTTFVCHVLGWLCHNLHDDFAVKAKSLPAHEHLCEDDMKKTTDNQPQARSTLGWSVHGLFPSSLCSGCRARDVEKRLGKRGAVRDSGSGTSISDFASGPQRPLTSSLRSVVVGW